MGGGRYSPAMRWFNAWCAVYGFVGGWLLLMLGYLPVWASLALIALGVPNLLIALPPLMSLEQMSRHAVYSWRALRTPGGTPKSRT